MNDLSAIALATAFGAGIVSFLSPCVLPLVPGYVSYVAGGGISHGQHAANSTWRLFALWLSFCPVLGFFTMFITLGAGATGLGQLLLRYERTGLSGTFTARANQRGSKPQFNYGPPHPPTENAWRPAIARSGATLRRRER